MDVQNRKKYKGQFVQMVSKLSFKSKIELLPRTHEATEEQDTLKKA